MPHPRSTTPRNTQSIPGVWYFRLSQNPSPSALADLIRASLVFQEKGKVILPMCFFLSKSHECAAESLPQRTASDFENAVPSIWLQINNRNSWDSVFVSTPYGIQRFPVTFLSVPDGGRGTGGLWQAIIAPELRCVLRWRKLQGFPQVCGRA